jgi:hypothetical protein
VGLGIHGRWTLNNTQVVGCQCACVSWKRNCITSKEIKKEEIFLSLPPFDPVLRIWAGEKQLEE